jgi:hypothetical protein
MTSSVAMEEATMIEEMPLEIASFHDCSSVTRVALRYALLYSQRSIR